MRASSAHIGRLLWSGCQAVRCAAKSPQRTKGRILLSKREFDDVNVVCVPNGRQRVGDSSDGGGESAAVKAVVTVGNMQGLCTPWAAWGEFNVRRLAHGVEWCLLGCLTMCDVQSEQFQDPNRQRQLRASGCSAQGTTNSWPMLA